MSIDDSGVNEQQFRLDALIEEFKQAQHRRLVKRGLALLNGAAAGTSVTRAASSLKKLN